MLAITNIPTMFSFWKKPVEESNMHDMSKINFDENFKDQNAEEVEDEENVFMEWYDLDPVCTNENVRYYLINARDVELIKEWAYNRQLDELHITKLSKNFNHQLIGSLKVAHIVDTCDFYLIDGQHRKQLLQRIDYSKLDFKIMVECYDVESEDELVNLFRIINSGKPLEPKDTPNKNAISIINKMKILYTSSNVCPIKDGTKTIIPYVTEKTLYQGIKKILEETGCNKEDLYDRIIKRNLLISKLEREEIEQRDWFTKKNISDNAWERATKTKFYLGFDTELRWVDSIIDKMSSK